jgi:hypothetical protein
VFPAAGEQRCWLHKIANVPDAMPKRLQPRAKTLLHEMMEAPTEADARAARETFRDEFTAKHPKAIDKLDRDWKQLTAFYAFPAEHWRHLRTTNPIESSFATIKLRIRKRHRHGGRLSRPVAESRAAGVPRLPGTVIRPSFYTTDAGSVFTQTTSGVAAATPRLARNLATAAQAPDARCVGLWHASW